MHVAPEAGPGALQGKARGCTVARCIRCITPHVAAILWVLGLPPAVKPPASDQGVRTDTRTRERAWRGRAGN